MTVPATQPIDIPRASERDAADRALATAYAAQYPALSVEFALRLIRRGVIR